MVATISHATETHMSSEEATTLEKFLQAQASDRECQAADQIVGILASLFTYKGDGALGRQVPVDPALQKYVPVTFHTHVLYYLIIAP